MARSAGAQDENMVSLLHQLEDLSVSPEAGSLSTPEVSGPTLRRPEIQQVDISSRPLVFFDLETTGLGVGCHITQLAAVRGEDTFSRFVLPKLPIDDKAQEITGITCQGNTMCHHGNKVQCVSIRQALQDFTEFLGTERSVLVGHNIKRFDCPRLLIPLRACGLLDRFQRAVHGFVDTLPLFRAFQPNLKTYKLSALHQHYLGREFNAHDARADVQALQDIVVAASVPPEVMTQHSFTLTNISDLHEYNKTKSRLLRGWTPLVEGKFVGKVTAERAAGSGLKLEEVREVYQRDGKAGVKHILQHRTDDGKPRDWRRELDGVCNFLESHPQTPTRPPCTTNAQRTSAYNSSPRQSSPGTTSRSPQTEARSPRAGARSPRTVACSPRTEASSLGRTSSSPGSVSSSPQTIASCRQRIASCPASVAISPPTVARSPPAVPSSPRTIVNSPPRTANFARKTERTTTMCAALSTQQRN